MKLALSKVRVPKQLYTVKETHGVKDSPWFTNKGGVRVTSLLVRAKAAICGERRNLQTRQGMAVWATLGEGESGELGL